MRGSGCANIPRGKNYQGDNIIDKGKPARWPTAVAEYIGHLILRQVA
jgi:hypothetical protein